MRLDGSSREEIIDYGGEERSRKCLVVFGLILPCSSKSLCTKGQCQENCGAQIPSRQRTLVFQRSSLFDVVFPVSQKGNCGGKDWRLHASLLVVKRIRYFVQHVALSHTCMY